MDAKRWYELAQDAITQEKYHEAKDMLLNVIQLDENFLSAYHDLALVYIHQGDFEQALQQYKHLEELDTSPGTQLRHAGLLLFLDQPQQAEQKFESVLHQLQPTDHDLRRDALKGLGDSYFRQNNFKQAQITYDLLLEEDPTSAFVWFSKAEAYYRAQAHEEAYTAIEKAIDLEHRPEFFAFKGDFYIRHDNYERALEQYRLAANLAPADAEIRLRMGFILRILQRSQDALEIFDQALERDPYSTEALENKIELLEEMKNFPAARATKEQLLRLHPENWELGQEVTMFYMEHGGYERAAQLLELMLKSNFQISEIWYRLAQCMKELGDYNRAHQAIIKAQEYDKEDNPDYAVLQQKIETLQQ